MKYDKLAPYGRVPVGQPGFDFPRGKDMSMAPMQKGIELAKQQQWLVKDYAPQPQWVIDGNYTVFSVFRDGKVVDHVVVNGDVEDRKVWFVQADEIYEGEEATAALGPDFDWTQVDPIAQVMLVSRILYRIMGTFPDLKWALSGRIKDRETCVLGTDDEAIARLNAEGEN